jgi:hypothetical protein
MKIKKLTAGACVAVLVMGVAAPAALAHDCSVAKKPANAGAVGSVNVVTGAFTPLKNNPGDDDKAHGGFIALTDGGDFNTSTFLHAPDGVLPPSREGGAQYNCDGRGLDSLSLCGP